MDYEKAYKYALERAKGAHNSAKSDKENDVTDKITEYTIQLTETIFPELKESEDERIRKDLIGTIHLAYDCGVSLNKEQHDKAIAWLEKQGEQKPADKVEPKFKVGDIIIHKELGGDYIHNPHKIIQVDISDKKYRLEGGLVVHFSEQDDYELVEQNPAWSEEDEKMRNNLIGLLVRLSANTRTDSTFVNYSYPCEIEWLKSLKDKYTWKPNDEQMSCFKQAIDLFKMKVNDDLVLQNLNSLYNNLLKL